MISADPVCSAATDFDLLRQFVSHGDDAAFGEIVQRHGGMVRGVCQRVLRDPAGADDAFQASFISLAKHASTLCETDQETESLGSWLYRVAVNACLQMKRKSDSRKRSEAAFARRQSDIEREQAVREEWLPILDEEIGALPQRFQSPLVLCHLQGRTQQDAAAELGLTYATIRRRLQQARELLKTRLVRRGFSDAGVMALPLLAIAGQMTLQSAPTAAATQALLAKVATGTASTSVGVAAGTTTTAVATGVLAPAAKWLIVSSTLAGTLAIAAVVRNLDWLQAGERVVASAPNPRAASLPASGRDADDVSANAGIVRRQQATDAANLQTGDEHDSGTQADFGTQDNGSQDTASRDTVTRQNSVVLGEADAAIDPAGLEFASLPEIPELPAGETPLMLSAFPLTLPVDERLLKENRGTELAVNSSAAPASPRPGNVPVPPGEAKPAEHPQLATLPKFGAPKPIGKSAAVQRVLEALESQRESIRERQQQAFAGGITPPAADEPQSVKGSITLGETSRRFFTREQAVELADWLEQQTWPANTPLRIVVNIDGTVEKYDTAAAALPALRTARFDKATH